MTNLDELKDEYEADKAAKEAAEKAAREADDAWDSMFYRAEQEDRDREKRELYRKWYNRILIHSGIKGEVRQRVHEEYGYPIYDFFVDGEDVCFDIHIEDDYEKVSSWRSRPTGHKKVVIGFYGDRKTFRKRKDGTYNWKLMGEKLQEIAATRRRRKEHEAAVNASSAKAANLRQELGLSTYCSAIDCSGDAGKVKLRVGDLVLTPDKAKEVVEALAALGIKVGY